MASRAFSASTKDDAMMKFLVPLTVPAVGGALIVAWTAGSAPAAAPAERPAPRCFLASQVNGFTSHGNDESVDVRVGASRAYRLSLAGPCPDVDSSLRVALRTRAGGSWICQGADAEIVVPSPTGTQRCLVTDVRPLSQSEVAAGRHRN
jgi:hypothetical protein